MNYAKMHSITGTHSILSACILCKATREMTILCMVYSAVLYGLQRINILLSLYQMNYCRLSLIVCSFLFIFMWPASGLDSKELPHRCRQSTVFWNPSSIQPYCLSHFPSCILTSSCLGVTKSLLKSNVLWLQVS